MAAVHGYCLRAVFFLIMSIIPFFSDPMPLLPAFPSRASSFLSSWYSWEYNCSFLPLITAYQSWSVCSWLATALNPSSPMSNSLNSLGVDAGSQQSGATFFLEELAALGQDFIFGFYALMSMLEFLRLTVITFLLPLGQTCTLFSLDLFLLQLLGFRSMLMTLWSEVYSRLAGVSTATLSFLSVKQDAYFLGVPTGSLGLQTLALVDRPCRRLVAMIIQLQIVIIEPIKRLPGKEAASELASEREQ